MRCRLQNEAAHTAQKALRCTLLYTGSYTLHSGASCCTAAVPYSSFCTLAAALQLLCSTVQYSTVQLPHSSCCTLLHISCCTAAAVQYSTVLLLLHSSCYTLLHSSCCTAATVQYCCCCTAAAVQLLLQALHAAQHVWRSA